jgi:hypothetical protein
VGQFVNITGSLLHNNSGEGVCANLDRWIRVGHVRLNQVTSEPVRNRTRWILDTRPEMRATPAPPDRRSMAQIQINRKGKCLLILAVE